MSDFKIAGHCTVCDAPCFEILVVQDAHEPRPGEPKRIGRPHDDAVRITFLLFDGSRNDQTFCASCAAELMSSQYTEIWRKNLRSWQREVLEKPNEKVKAWFSTMFTNGLLCEMGRRNWKDLANGG